VAIRAQQLAAVILCLGFATEAPGEVFVLRNNGRVEGELVNATETPREKYVIRTAAGGTVTLARQQVARVLTQSPAEEEYDQIRPQFADTVEAQWEIAQWCLHNGLPTERKVHLRRIIELAPDHAEARRALGYTKVGDEWKTQAQRMTERGLVRYRGRWRFPQEVALIEERKQQEVTEKGWYRDIKRWLGWLDTQRAQQAVDNIREIDDPNAVPALAQYLEDDLPEHVKLLLIEALAAIDNPAAVDALGRNSLADANHEVRLTCIDHLKKQPRPAIVKLYIQSLGSKDNAIINRAAIGLKEMNDRTAIRPLIDALQTTHRTKIRQGSPGGIGAGFGGPGGGGLSVGGQSKVVESHLRNPAVLEALVTLSGVNLGYDEQAWKHWLSTEKPPAELDARRD